MHLVAPGEQHAARRRDRRAGDRHPAAGIDVLGRTERARARRPPQLQPVGRAQGHVLGAVRQRHRAAIADDDPGRVARVAGEEPRGAEAPPGPAQRRPHRGAGRRGPGRGAIAARADGDGHACAARKAQEGGERLSRAEPGPPGLARRGLQAPARAAVAKPDDDRRAAGGDGGRREVRAGARGRERLRPPEPSARAERDHAEAAPGAPRALHHDQAAAVGGDARVDGAVGGARAHEHPRRPERGARRRGPPAHAGERPGVGPRARAHDECPAVGTNREGGGDVARRDDLGGIRGRGGDEHQPHGPATRARRLHAWGTPRAARRLRRGRAAAWRRPGDVRRGSRPGHRGEGATGGSRRAPSSSIARVLMHEPRVSRNTSQRAARRWPGSTEIISVDPDHPGGRGGRCCRTRATC